MSKVIVKEVILIKVIAIKVIAIKVIWKIRLEIIILI